MSFVLLKKRFVFFESFQRNKIMQYVCSLQFLVSFAQGDVFEIHLVICSSTFLLYIVRTYCTTLYLLIIQVGPRFQIVLVLYCHVTHGSKLCFKLSLKAHILAISLGQYSSTMPLRCEPRLGFHLEEGASSILTYSCFWQNSFPGGCRKHSGLLLRCQKRRTTLSAVSAIKMNLM